MDLSSITFSANHKLEAAAKDAATGIRLLALAFLASAAALALDIFAASTGTSGLLISLLTVALLLLAFAAGGYGAYLAASALDWSGFITGVVVLSVFVPYLKFICFIVLVVSSIDLIQKAGYRVSLIGPLRKRAAA